MAGGTTGEGTRGEAGGVGPGCRQVVFCGRGGEPQTRCRYILDQQRTHAMVTNLYRHQQMM